MKNLMFLLPLIFGIFSVSKAQGDLLRLLEISTKAYPEIRMKQLETAAAAKEVTFQKADAIPQLNASYQANYATANNITGMFYPGQVLPISGPPSADNSYEMVYGSAAALLLNWSPFTFGKRQSRINTAGAELEYHQANEDLAVLEHQVKFVHAYLNYWSAGAKVEALEKNRERFAFNLELSRSLVENGLRPGVDSAQFNSLFIRSRLELLQAEKMMESHKATVRELLGDESVIVMDQRLGEFQVKIPEDEPGLHPLIQRAQQQTAVSTFEKNQLSRSLLPDLNFWGTAFARGSAITTEGVFLEATQGLSFSRYNYGLGFQVTLPIFQFAQTRHRIQKQDFLIGASQAYEEKVFRALDKDRIVALVTLEKALESAKLAPEFVTAAQYSFDALQSRYDAGLINMAELLQGQATLAEAEAEAIQAQAEMWQALLYYSAVLGNMDLFTNNFD